MKRAMKNTITLESLKAERQSLREELQALEKLIAIHERRHKTSDETKKQGLSGGLMPLPHSIRDQVVTTTYNLIHELKRPVSSQEIFERVDSLRILDGRKNKQATLAAILDQITKTKKPKLKRVDRGVYDIIS